MSQSSVPHAAACHFPVEPRNEQRIGLEMDISAHTQADRFCHTMVSRFIAQDVAIALFFASWKFHQPVLLDLIIRQGAVRVPATFHILGQKKFGRITLSAARSGNRGMVCACIFYEMRCSIQDILVPKSGMGNDRRWWRGLGNTNVARRITAASDQQGPIGLRAVGDANFVQKIAPIGAGGQDVQQKSRPAR